MTCIVGIEVEEGIYIGGDSQGSNGYTTRAVSTKKVFKTGKFVIGYTDSFRLGQLLEQNLVVSDQEENVEDLRYIITVFIPALRECLIDGGYCRIKDNAEHGGTFLVGYKGSLYKVQNDYGVLTFSDGICAVGCGTTYALASMYTSMLLGQVDDPVKVIHTALDTASYLSEGVAPPYTIEYQVKEK